MGKYRVESSEVLYSICGQGISTSDIDELKKLASLNPRKRIRLCMHHSPQTLLQEMFIVHERHCYVRPHKHLKKIESIKIIEGEVDVVTFDDGGNVINVISMGDITSGKIFYFRLNQSEYHTFIIRSDVLVFHEITTGPFLRDETIYPKWAPVLDVDGLQYLSNLKESLDNER